MDGVRRCARWLVVALAALSGPIWRPDPRRDIPARALRSAARRSTATWVAVLAAALTAASLSGSPAQAQPLPAAPAANRSGAVGSETFQRPDLVSARMAAATLNHEVLVTDETSATTQTFVQPNGTSRTQIAAAPVRVAQPDGSWKPVDYTLVPVTAADGTTAGYAPAVSPVDVVFSAGGTGPAVTLDKGTRGVDLSWAKTLPAPTLDGATARYDLGGGQTLVLTANTDGFEQSLELAAPPTVAPKLRLDFDPTGLDLAANRRGGFDFVKTDATGAATSSVLFTVPTPVMYSAKLDDGEHTQVAPLTVKETTDPVDGSPALDLTAAMGFLTDPATVYPVQIDPVVAVVNGIDDTYISTSGTTNNSSAYDLRVGTTSTPNTRRSLLRFNTTPLTGMHVTSASLKLFEVDSGSCTAQPIKAYPVTSAWTASTVTWATQPTVDTGAGTAGTASFAHGNETLGCANAADTIDITNMTQAWANGTITNNGLELQAGDEVGTAGDKRFCAMNLDTSGNSDCITTANYPTLTVTYNSTPGTPTGVDYSPHVVGPTGSNYTTLLTPTITGTATNADGSPYRLEVTVQHHVSFPGEGTGTVWTGASEPTTAGATASLTLPTGVLLQGKHYQYQARATVVSGTSGTDTSAWTALAGINPNINPPAAPVITCTAYTPANTYTAANATNTCTFKTASGDGSGYVWSLDNPTPTTEIWDATNSGAAMTVPVTPGAGWHTLYAFARDHALHVSTTASYSFGVGNGGILSPAALDSTAKAVALSSSATSTYTKVTYQWAKGATGTTWANIPVANVTQNGTSTPINAWPLTGSTANGLTTFTGYNWDVAATLAANAQPDGAVQIRAIFTTATNTTFTSPAVTFTLNRGVFSSAAPTAQVGPGTVSLLTGDYGVSATDAAVGGLSVGRTITNLTPVTNTGAAGVFGPGWTAALTGAGASGYVLVDTNRTLGSIVLKAGDGTELVYTQTATNTFTGVDDADDGSTLTYSTTLTDPATNTTATGYQLKQADGTVTTWFLRTGVWQPVKVDPPATADVSLSGFDTSGRPNLLLAPAPAGVTCTIADHNRSGCQWLTITYAPATSLNIGPAEAQWGNYLNQVSGISWSGYDPATSAMATKDVASYLYDNTGRLRATWDPRITPALKTRYTYTTAGRLASTQAPGRNAQNLNYDTSGRLASVSWTDPANGPATQAVAYGLAVSGVTGAPDVSATTAATWGQTIDLPYVGGAVFPPSHLPTVNATTGAYTPTATQWPYAAITYADVNGQTVNTAAYGASAWQIDTTRYNADGNPTWTLTAGNRAQALTPSSSTDPYVASQTTSAARANLLAEITTYSADAVDVLSTLGPAHPVRLSNGVTSSARVSTSYTYDEGAPAGGPYHLQTTTTVKPVALDGATVPAADIRIIKTGYNPIDGASNTGATSGWILRAPTTQTVQMGTTASTADLVTMTRYDNVGRTVESRLPGGTATDANTTKTTYYTAAANATYPTCGGKAHFEGQVCRTDPGGPSSAGYAVPTKAYTYNLFGQPLTVTETSGPVTRTSTATYDAAGRPSTTALAVTGLASSTPVPSSTITYSATTGDATTLTAGTAPLNVTLTATYDTLGRQATQVDADSNTSTYTYDIDGNVKTLNDGQGTYTYAYGSATDHRGLVTSIDAGMGALSTFTGSYDADGNLVNQTYPNGTTAAYTYDNIGTATALKYTLPTYSGGPAANSLSFTNTADAFAQTVRAQSPASAQDFTYDNAGRLTTTADTYAGACTTRAYGFDKQSDRIGFTTYNPASGGLCQVTAASSTKNSTFDNANRITNAGYTYDQLGRTLTIPSSDLAGGSSAISIAYYDNDKPVSQAQGTNTKTFTLDPAGRYRQATDAAASVENRRIINHYGTATGDSPSWIASSANSGATWQWERNVSAFSGLAATQSSTGLVTLQIADLRGNIVASLPDAVPSSTNPAGATPSSYGETTEFGQLRSTGGGRYGWLGAHQRSADATAGLVLMGARLYNPVTGTFLSRDPVAGGNANDYTYPSNPLDQSDLTGESLVSSLALKLVKRLVSSARIILNGGCLGAGFGYWICVAIVGGLTTVLFNWLQAGYQHGNWGYSWTSFINDFSWGALLAVGGRFLKAFWPFISVGVRLMGYRLAAWLARLSASSAARLRTYAAAIERIRF